MTSAARTGGPPATGAWPVLRVRAGSPGSDASAPPSAAPARWVPTAAGRHLRGRRSRDTAPELALRSALHRLGARFRLHRRLGGSCQPDLVLPARRVAVWVDGCFFHSCPAHGRTRPFTGPNAALWTEKLARVRERDRIAAGTAEGLGWTVVRVWECAVAADADLVAREVLAGRSPGPASRRP